MSLLSPRDSQAKATPETVTQARERDPKLEANANYEAPFLALKGPREIFPPLTVKAITKERELIGRFVLRLIRTVDCVKGGDLELANLASNLEERASALKHLPPAHRLAEIATQQHEQVLELCDLVYARLRSRPAPDTLPAAFQKLSALQEKLFGTDPRTYQGEPSPS